MHLRRGFFRLLLLATLGWVAFVAVNAWGTMPRSQMPVVSTQLSDYCRFSVHVTSDMSLYVVRYEAFAQYHRARTSLQGTRCRDFHQLSDDQVADIAGRYFIRWRGAGS